MIERLSGSVRLQRLVPHAYQPAPVGDQVLSAQPLAPESHVPDDVLATSQCTRSGRGLDPPSSMSNGSNGLSYRVTTSSCSSWSGSSAASIAKDYATRAAGNDERFERNNAETPQNRYPTPIRNSPSIGTQRARYCKLQNALDPSGRSQPTPYTGAMPW